MNRICIFVCGLAGVVLSSCATASFSEYKGVGRVKRYDFYSAQLPDSFDGFRIAFASDFHYESRFTARRLPGAVRALQSADADVLLYVTDVVEKPDKNIEFIQKVQAMDVPVLLLINKIDLSNQEALTKIVESWHDLLPKAEIIPISATARFNIDAVMKRIKDLLPDSPPYFDKDQWTDKPARFFVTEIIREKILLYYDKEIPYAVEVVVEQFKEDEKSIHINVVIYVERESQKGIIIGKQGKALKKVATEARKSLEKFFGKSIYLETFVKVDKDWRSSDKELKNFGYNLD